MATDKITLAALKALPFSPSSGTKKFIWDVAVAGFGAYRTMRGHVTFLYQYAMPGGKTQSRKLGNLGEMTIDQAREAAAEMALARRRGEDPIAELKKRLRDAAAVTALVLGTYAEDYLRRRQAMGKPLNKAQTAIVRRDVVGLLGDKRMDQLTVRDVEAFADALMMRGPSARRMGLTYLKAILNEAVRREVIVRNVAEKVETNKSGERTRRFNEFEMQRFVEAARDLGVPRGDVYEVLLRTLKRKEEISRLLWSDLDVPSRTWTLDESKTKSRVGHRIVLPPQVMAIIERQQPDPKLRVGPVFTLDGGKTSPEMGSQVKDLLDAHLHKRLEAANERDGTAITIAHFTVHDLRTTGASRLQEKPFQFNATLIDAILLHQPAGTVTRIYQRAQLDNEAGEALERWNDHVDELMERGDAWPGGPDRMMFENGEERKRRIGLLRAGWPQRSDQKRAAERRASENDDRKSGRNK